jgi:hypothetical protein
MAKKRSAAKTYSFEGIIERFPGKGGYFYVYFPYDVEKEFGVRGFVRMKGTLNGVKIDRALIPKGDGTHNILVPIDLRRKTKTSLGDKVKVTLGKCDAPEEVKIPEELEAALDLEPAVRKAFDKLGHGVRRGMAYWVNSGKKPETRVQRALEILRRFQSGEMVFGGRIVKLE